MESSVGQQRWQWAMPCTRHRLMHEDQRLRGEMIEDVSLDLSVWALHRSPDVLSRRSWMGGMRSGRRLFTLCDHSVTDAAKVL